MKASRFSLSPRARGNLIGLAERESASRASLYSISFFACARTTLLPTRFFFVSSLSFFVSLCVQFGLCKEGLCAPVAYTRGLFSAGCCNG